MKERIESFIDEHHVMSLATFYMDDISVCNLFYAYDKENYSFVVASSENTKHIKHIKQNSKVAGSIVLETKSISKIQGLQFRGEFLQLEDKELKKLYFKAFPQSLLMNPTLWQIKIDYFKMTDNRLGFGKKLIWEISA